MKIPSSLSVLLVLFTGCASSKFIPYEGAQEKWPTAPGAFVESNAVPTYFGPPSRPYDVVGFIDATTAPIRRSGVVRYAAEQARKQGADAIVVLQQGSEYIGSYAHADSSTSGQVDYTGHYRAHTTTHAQTTPLFAGKAVVLVIRWKPNSP